MTVKTVGDGICPYCGAEVEMVRKVGLRAIDLGVTYQESCVCPKCGRKHRSKSVTKGLRDV